MASSPLTGRLLNMRLRTCVMRWIPPMDFFTFGIVRPFISLLFNKNVHFAPPGPALVSVPPSIALQNNPLSRQRNLFLKLIWGGRLRGTMFHLLRMPPWHVYPDTFKPIHTSRPRPYVNLIVPQVWITQCLNSRDVPTMQNWYVGAAFQGILYSVYTYSIYN